MRGITEKRRSSIATSLTCNKERKQKCIILSDMLKSSGKNIELDARGKCVGERKVKRCEQEGYRLYSFLMGCSMSEVKSNKTFP
jgi:hypothetical protein